jgi:hypothetical protein
MSILSVSGRDVKINGDAHRKSLDKVQKFINRSSNLRPYRECLEGVLEMYAKGYCCDLLRKVFQYINDPEFNFDDLFPYLHQEQSMYLEISRRSIAGELTKNINPAIEFITPQTSMALVAPLVLIPPTSRFAERVIEITRTADGKTVIRFN